MLVFSLVRQFINCMKSKPDYLSLSDLDQRVQPLRAACSAAYVPSKGWLRTVREAVGFTQAKIASRAGIKRQSYAQFEAAEERGAVSIASLRHAAESMDCDLIYFIVPREVVSGTYSGLAQVHNPRFKSGQLQEIPLALESRSGELPIGLL